MPKKVIVPTSLNFQPRPSYPYSPGAQAGGMIFTAGQVAWDESGKIIAIGDIRGQTQQTLKNVRAVLNAGGAGTITATGNITAQKCVELYRAFIANSDIVEKLQHELSDERALLQKAKSKEAEKQRKEVLTSQIEELGNKIITKVYDKFKIKLEWEIKIIGQK